MTLDDYESLLWCPRPPSTEFLSRRLMLWTTARIMRNWGLDAENRSKRGATSDLRASAGHRTAPSMAENEVPATEHLTVGAGEQTLEIMPARGLPPMFLSSRQWDADGTRQGRA